MATQEQIELRRKWVEALRSGKYEQTKGALRNSKGYCCLGVLCEISGQGEWDGTEHYNIGSSCSAYYVPYSLSDYIGLTQHSGEFAAESGERVHLTDLNDNGKSFPEIADLIESNPPGLFID